MAARAETVVMLAPRRAQIITNVITTTAAAATGPRLTIVLFKSSPCSKVHLCCRSSLLILLLTIDF